jgi:nitroreductase
VELSEAMRTTPSCREFTDRPVTDDDIRAILDDARFAGSGGNRQGQHVIVVKDEAIRIAMRDLIVPVWRQYVAQVRAGERPFNPVIPTSVDLAAAADEPAPTEFVDHFERVPALLAVVVDMRQLAAFDKDLDRYTLIGGGSVYPFCQNVLLAARNRGIGATMTTFLAGREQQARELLRFPDHYALVATIALGWPVRQLTKLSRKAVEEFTTVDTFDGEAFSPGA